MIFFNIAAYGLILLSAVHLAFAFVMYETLNTDFLWFSSASLALFYTGVINIVFCRSNERSGNSIFLVQLSNMLITIFSVLAFIILKEIQTLIIFIFSITLFMMWLFRKKDNDVEEDN
jgi:hypothetical protein